MHNLHTHLYIILFTKNKGNETVKKKGKKENSKKNLCGEEEHADKAHPGVQSVEIGKDTLDAFELGPYPEQAEPQCQPLDRQMHRLPRVPPGPPCQPPVRQDSCGPRVGYQHHCNCNCNLQARSRNVTCAQSAKACFTFAGEDDEADDHNNRVKDLWVKTKGKR